MAVPYDINTGLTRGDMVWQETVWSIDLSCVLFADLTYRANICWSNLMSQGNNVNERDAINIPLCLKEELSFPKCLSNEILRVAHKLQAHKVCVNSWGPHNPSTDANKLQPFKVIRYHILFFSFMLFLLTQAWHFLTVWRHKPVITCDFLKVL